MNNRIRHGEFLKNNDFNLLNYNCNYPRRHPREREI